MDVILTRPTGAISTKEWSGDRHRLIERPPEELREIDHEVELVRAMLRQSTARASGDNIHPFPMHVVQSGDAHGDGTPHATKEPQSNQAVNGQPRVVEHNTRPP